MVVVSEHQVDLLMLRMETQLTGLAHSHTKWGLLSQTHKRKLRLESQRALKLKLFLKI